MKSFVNKALFYKEWKNAKWITLMMIINTILFKFLSIIDELNYISELKSKGVKLNTPSLIHWFNNSLKSDLSSSITNINNGYYFSIMTLATILLVIILFRSEKNNNTYSLLASMPFKRKDIVKTKWITGILSILINYTIAFILINIFYFLNTSVIFDPYIIILEWLAINMLCFMALFSFLFFIQNIIGSCIPAIAIGYTFQFIPSGVLHLLIRVINVNIKLPYDSSIIQNIYKLDRTFQNINNIPVASYGGYDSEVMNFYNNFNEKIIFLVLVILITYLLSIFAYNKVSMAKIGNLFLFSFLEPIFKCGVAICTGLLLGNLLGGDLGHGNILSMDAAIVLGLTLGYVAAHQAVNYFNKL